MRVDPPATNFGDPDLTSDVVTAPAEILDTSDATIQFAALVGDGFVTVTMNRTTSGLAAPGDWIEFDQIGAYSNALSTSFNGFTSNQFIEVSDEPISARCSSRRDVASNRP